MMHLDFWQALGVVCGALIAAGTLIGLTTRWVVRPVWRTIRRLNEVADDILGEPPRGNRPRRLSLAERVAENTEQSIATAASVAQQTSRIEELAHRLDEHLTWHAGGGAARSNGPRPHPTPTRSTP